MWMPLGAVLAAKFWQKYGNPNMSRIGKKPINVPKNVKVSLTGNNVQVEGPKGKLTFAMHSRIKPAFENDVFTVSAATSQKTDKALHGTSRSIVANMIKGVTEGFTKELEIQGVGFKAQIQGKVLNLALGFTHPVEIEVPEGVIIKTPKPTQIIIEGIDKAKVGYLAATIRKVYEVEPYKGKGVRYKDEVVRRKAGKTVTK